MKPNEKLSELVDNWIVAESISILSLNDLEAFRTKAGDIHMDKLKSASGISQATVAECIGLGPASTHLSRWLKDPDRIPRGVYRRNIKALLGEDPYEN